MNHLNNTPSAVFMILFLPVFVTSVFLSLQFCYSFCYSCDGVHPHKTSHSSSLAALMTLSRNCCEKRH